MKPMTTHGSATVRKQSPHVTNPTRTNTVVNALKRRAQAVLNDKSIDPQTRAIIRYGLEVNDPWLAELVRRADAGETIVETVDFSQEPAYSDVDSSEEQIETLTEIICRAGDEPETKSAALLVLMSALENASHPKALANTAKHVAFTRCAELNLYGMVDAQIDMLKGELFRDNTPLS
jgi:hypothetical protein